MVHGRKTGFLVTGSFDPLPLEKTCEILKGIGYDAVEMKCSWMDSCADSTELARQMAVIEKAGLEISELVIQEDYVDADAEVCAAHIARSAEAIRRCGGAGIGTVNLFTGPRPWIDVPLTVGREVTMGAAWDKVFTAFDALVPVAEKSGVRIAVENVFGMLCHDFYTAQHLIRHYDSPCLGVNFDPSHDQLAGNTDPEFIMRQWGDRIFHIHMKDAAGTQKVGENLFPPLGDGFVDWDGFVRGLDAIGYDGVLSVEYEAWQHLDRHLGGDWIRAAEESFAALDAVLRG